MQMKKNNSFRGFWEGIFCNEIFFYFLCIFQKSAHTIFHHENPVSQDLMKNYHENYLKVLEI